MPTYDGLVIKERGIKAFDNFLVVLEREGYGSLGLDVMEKATRAMAKIVLEHIQKTSAFTDRDFVLRPSFQIRKTTVRERKRARGRALPLYRIKGAPHWFLVNFGHGGPAPADPHPYVEPAFFGTRAEQRTAFQKASVRAYRQIVRRIKAGNLTKRQTRLVANKIL